MNRHRKGTPGALARVARHVVLLYPQAFRRRHGKALQETLLDQITAALGGQTGWRAARTILAELTDAAACGLRMRLAPHAHRSANDFKLRKGGPMFQSLLQDVRFALRTLLRRPGFALAAVTVLGVGIGLNSAVFSLVNAYLLRPLPFPDAERLVSVAPLPREAPRSAWRELPRELGQVQWPSQDEVIEELVAWDLDLLTLVGGQGSEALEGAWVTPGYFAALGAKAQLGRVFDQSDAAPDAPTVAVISHGLWQRRFGGDPAVLGRTVSVFSGDRPQEAEVFTIIGVLPPDFWFINRFTDMLPILKSPRLPSLVKLRPGVTPERAAQHLTGIVRSQVSGLPPDWQMHLEPAQDAYVFNVRPVLLALSGAVGLVLLLACANAAILMLVRALGRRQEMTLRRALGAGRMRVVRQLLVEGLVISLSAGTAGSLLAWAGLRWVSPLVESQLRTSAPGGTQRILQLDPALLAVSVGAAVLTGLLFALAPALASTGQKLSAALAVGGRGTSGSRGHRMLRQGLIAAEVALSLALLIGAALMTRSALHLSRVELGFEPQGVLTANLSLRRQTYPGPDEQRAFVDRLLPRVESLSGIESAGILASWPFQEQVTGTVLAQDLPDRQSGPRASFYVVSPGYFSALRIPLLRGRLLDNSDRAEGAQVTVISRSLSQRLWPDGDPLGKRIRFLEDEGDDWATIVGVVGDVRETLTGPETPDVYVPYAQVPRLFMFLNVRLSTAPSAAVAAIGDILNDIDPSAALYRVDFVQDLVNRQGSRPRFLAGVLGGFSGFAVLLALLGVGSLISYTVSRRRHEIAVRMALGAAPGRVLRLFLRQGAWVVALGLAMGLVLGIALSGTLASQLYGVDPMSWPTFAAAALLLAAAALSTVWLCARRAEKTDPSLMLKDI